MFPIRRFISLSNRPQFKQLKQSLFARAYSASPAATNTFAPSVVSSHSSAYTLVLPFDFPANFSTSSTSKQILALICTGVTLLLIPTTIMDAQGNAVDTTISIPSKFKGINFLLYDIAPSRRSEPNAPYQRLTSMGVLQLPQGSHHGKKTTPLAIALYLAYDAHGMEQTLQLVPPNPLSIIELRDGLKQMLTPMIEERTGSSWENISSCVQFDEAMTSIYIPSSTRSKNNDNDSILPAGCPVRLDLRGEILVIEINGSIVTRIQSRVLSNSLLAVLSRHSTQRIPVGTNDISKLLPPS